MYLTDIVTRMLAMQDGARSIRNQALEYKEQSSKGS